MCIISKRGVVGEETEHSVRELSAFPPVEYPLPLKGFPGHSSSLPTHPIKATCSSSFSLITSFGRTSLCPALPWHPLFPQQPASPHSASLAPFLACSSQKTLEGMATSSPPRSPNSQTGMYLLKHSHI